MTGHSTLTLILAALVGVLAVARCTRLVTSDTWPPILWARLRWQSWTANGTFSDDGVNYRAAWADLFLCPFCFAPYAAAGDLALAWYSDLATWWWLVNLWAAVSYAAAMVVVRDEPPAEDE